MEPAIVIRRAELPTTRSLITELQESTYEFAPRDRYQAQKPGAKNHQRRFRVVVIVPSENRL